eukprot:m.71544 g.71544  ORF g.71544 m.71544 type:complete len:192 (-) comp8354_c0_seq1:2397-2972(-)
MDELTMEQLAELEQMDGYSANMMESYLEVTPDGTFEEDQYLSLTHDIPDSYLAVEPTWLDAQEQLLLKQPWFRPSPFGRKQSDSELKGKPKGAFLVRASSQKGHYAVSVKRKSGVVDHMLVLPSWAGNDSDAPGQTQYRIGTYTTDLFNTIPKLIAFYIGHPFFDDERLIGIVQSEDQDGGFYIDVQPVAN